MNEGRENTFPDNERLPTEYNTQGLFPKRIAFPSDPFVGGGNCG